ncbi:MAG TPA: DUF3617 family protein [Usitatibacter sp.]|nr:DUF3617 family protein [Usitatibacter sp.]
MSRLSKFSLALALAFAPVAFAQITLEPGLWHLTTNSTTNGKPEPTQEQDECLTPNELSDLNKYFAPELEGVTAKCQRAQRPTKDKSIAHHMKCQGKGFTIDMESAVKIDGPRRFTANLTMDTKTPKERALVKADILAERNGPCPAK